MKTLIVKSLDACNLRCDYCSVGEKTESGILSEEDMKKALCLFAGYARECGECQVIFHGGEPMLLPAQQYARCIQHVRAEFPSLQFQFSMQTNGTFLNKEYLSLFKKYEIHVGVSLDGAREIHDGQRRDCLGKGTYERVMDNIRVLQAHEIPVAALMVVTKPALRADLSFLRELDTMGLPLKINPLLNLGEAARHPELALHPGDYSSYLIRVFEYALENRLSIRLSPLSELMNAIIADKRPSGCIYNPQCCRDFLCVDHNGSLYPCGRFADVHANALGTVESGITPEGLMALQRLEERRSVCLPEECRVCCWLPICNAGCSADGASRTGKNVPCAVCEDQKKLFHYLHNQGLKIIKKQLLKERQRLYQLLEGKNGI